MKLMQHEEAEQKAGIDRQFHLNLGKAYLVEKAHRQKKSSMLTKSRLCYKLFLPGISKALASPCHKHGKEHTCLNAFRSQPGLVLRWRKMWFALPKKIEMNACDGCVQKPGRSIKMEEMMMTPLKCNFKFLASSFAVMLSLELLGSMLTHPEGSHGRACACFFGRSLA